MIAALTTYAGRGSLAAQENHSKAVKKILPLINALDEDEETALSLAAREDHVEVVKELLQLVCPLVCLYCRFAALAFK